jgi:solute carrier family 25 folate transporter 32
VFYSGLVPSLIGAVHVAVQFPLYERLKILFSKPLFSTALDSPDLVASSTGASPSTFAIISSSVLSKIAASCSTYPHEVIRTRLQNQRGGTRAPGNKYTGILRTIQVVYREEGWRAFYAGMGVNMFRTLPSNAITLLTFELVSRRLKQWKDEEG